MRFNRLSMRDPARAGSPSRLTKVRNQPGFDLSYDFEDSSPKLRLTHRELGHIQPPLSLLEKVPQLTILRDRYPRGG